MTVGFVLDGLIVALLLATIVYCALVSKKLKDLDQATKGAESAAAGLREASDEGCTALNNTSQKATVLNDDMSFLLERGNGLADHLTELTRKRLRATAGGLDDHSDVVANAKSGDVGCRESAAASGPKVARDKAGNDTADLAPRPPSPGRSPRSRVERALIDALRGSDRGSP